MARLIEHEIADELAAVVGSVREGDKVRATFVDHDETLIVEGRVHSHPGIEKLLYVGNSRIPEVQITDGFGKPLPFLAHVAVLERLNPDFYTNAPGRKPRIGDLARIDGRDATYVLVGEGWVVVRPLYTVDMPARDQADVYRYMPGELALVGAS